jgi:ATP-dependent metalloprotease FtsH
MLNRINEGNLYFSSKNHLNARKPVTQGSQTVELSQNTPQTIVKPNIEHLKANFISFGRKDEQPDNERNLQRYISDFGANFTKSFSEAQKLANYKGSAELDNLHLLKVMFDESGRAIKENAEDLPTMARMLQIQNPEIMQDPVKRAQVAIFFEKFAELLDKEIETLPKKKIDKPVTQLSPELAVTLEKVYQNALNSGSNMNGPILKEEAFIMTSATLQDRSTGEPTQTAAILQEIFLQIRGAVRDIESGEINKPAQKTKKAPVSVAGSDTTAIVPISHYKQDFNLGDKKPRITLSNEPPYNLYDVGHYNNKAKTLATIVSAGKNSIFTHDHGAMPELLAHGFTKLLHESGFKNLNPQNTAVELLDTNVLFKKGDDPIKTLESIATDASKDGGKKTVIFVKDFDRLLLHMFALGNQKPQFDPSVIFKSNAFGPNVQIVGLMNNKMYQSMSNTEHGTFITQLLNDTVRNQFERVQLGSPSPEEAKVILKEQPGLLTNITSQYGKEGITIQPEAIDKAVDISITNRKGSMPGKAIDLLSFVAASKATATGNAFGVITKDDVETFSQNYPELRQSPESGGGSFAVVHDTGIRLKDVGGAAQAKEVVNEMLDFLDPVKSQKFKNIGAKMPKGILLHGSPGNGKTYLAKAIAGEAGVPFVSVSGSEFVEKYVGVGAARVRELFDFAAEQAASNDKNTAIIFIDEFDSLGKKRGAGDSGGDREAEQTLNQLLVAMDGLNKYKNANIIVIAATNRPDLLDDAVKRPGRFDRQVAVPNPSNDVEARYEILLVHARDKEIEGKREEVIREVAESTAGQSGAGLADIVNRAAMIAAKDERTKITFNDFIEAKLEAVAGKIHNIKQPEWYKELVVTHECGHALVRQTFLDVTSKDTPWQKPNEIDVITTDSRGEYGGAVYNKPGENVTNTYESVFAELASKFGGYAVEKQLFNMDGSWGISSDLKNATDLAKDAVTKMGVGANTRLISTAADPFVQELMKDEIKQDIKLLIQKSSAAAGKIVEFYRPFIEEYRQEYSANAGKGGQNLSGKDFKVKLAKWVAKDPARAEQLQQLKADLTKLMEEARTPTAK